MSLGLGALSEEGAEAPGEGTGEVDHTYATEVDATTSAAKLRAYIYTIKISLS